MKNKTVNAVIMLNDDFGIAYKVSDIAYTIYEDDSFIYTFTPFYPVIDFLPSTLFQGIPGLDLSLRREYYIRRNEIPVFISERTPSSNRVDLPELLDKVGMNYLNPLEWLIKTDTIYSGDNLYVISPEEFDALKYKLIANTAQPLKARDRIKIILERLAVGETEVLNDYFIQAASIADLYTVLTSVMAEDMERLRLNRIQGIKKAKAEGKYKGRTKIAIEEPLWEEVCNKYHAGKLTADEAAKKCGISRSTFFRRLV